MRKISAAVIGCIAMLAAGAAFAQTAQRVRGVVASLDGANLVVKSREGPDVTIKLSDNWSAGGIKSASIAEVKAGSFVGVAAMPQSGGTFRALEVLIFPAGMKPNEGHFAWDLMPESTMTNAAVAEVVTSMSGNTLRMSAPGGDKTIVVPPDAPIVTFAPATREDVKPGAPVFIGAQRQPDGSLTAARVTVGNNGVAPPM